MDRDRTARRGRAYLAHLTDADRLLLDELGDNTTSGRLADDPATVEDLLASDEVYDAVFAAARGGEAMIGVSPFLVFAVAINRAQREFARATYVQEWAGPRQRVPVFGTDALRGFLDDAAHRLFLAELLGSYTHVSAGAVTYRRHGVVYRRRVSELDLAGLAGLVDHVTEDARPGLYRRLGDLALLLTGVFPDHTARTRFAPIEVERLARSAAPHTSSDAFLEALEVRGAIGLLEQMGRQWYGKALGTVPVRTDQTVVLASVREQFEQARRVLNHLADTHLFPFRAEWFPVQG